MPLPAGLVESDRLPEPIFTPTTKAAEGHDLPLSPEEAADLVGRGLAERLKELTLDPVRAGAPASRWARASSSPTRSSSSGSADGELILVDEVCTPDSSRFWPADAYEPGRAQPSFDKQYVRDWLDASGWDHEPPPPELPAEVVDATARPLPRGVRAHHRRAVRPTYLHRMGVRRRVTAF